MGNVTYIFCVWSEFGLFILAAVQCRALRCVAFCVLFCFLFLVSSARLLLVAGDVCKMLSEKEGKRVRRRKCFVSVLHSVIYFWRRQAEVDKEVDVVSGEAAKTVYEVRSAGTRGESGREGSGTKKIRKRMRLMTHEVPGQHTRTQGTNKNKGATKTVEL